MIRTVQRELSATSNVNAPKFNFKEYVRGQVYKNNSTDIDFVTDNGNLYVPVSDNVTANKNLAKEDNNFMLLVAKGEQGEQGVKGEKGADGRTPAVYARFDGKQMVFYTNVLDEDGNIVYNDNGTPATRRMAATNDLTGPSWKPELVNDTIVWHKTKEDEAPKSIPLSSLIKQTAPVLLRVDSDNTRRMDEMDESGPANYIQWKYEGDEHWNNLISISELMNLTLAGVSIWYDEEDGHYHFGHKEVEKASYAASHTGKQIITAVELGEILYDAGPIPLEDWSTQIAALHDYICQVEEKIPTDYVKSVENILPDENGNVDLPDYVKTVNNQVPDNNGNVQIELPNLDEYLKATDLRFKVQNDSDGRFLYFSTRRGEEGTWQKVLEATCSCSVGTRWIVTFGTPNPANAEMVCNDRIVRPGDTMQVRDGDVICITATADNYQRFYECYTIKSNRTFAPQLTPEVVPETKYQACVIDDTELADKIYIGITSANKQQACLENLSDGTTVRGKATRSGYKDKTVSGTINGDDLTLHITGDWAREVDRFNITEGTESNPFEICLSEGTHTFSVTPSTDVKWISNNWEYLTINEDTGKATLLAVTPQYVIVKAQSTIDSSVEARCKVIIKDCTEPETTLSVSPASLSFDNTAGDKTFTVTTDADSYTVTPRCDGWVTTSKSGNTVTVTVTANTGESRTCDITVAAGNKTKTVSITQEAGEVTPTTYTVGVRNNSSCPADTMYLSLDEHDFEDHNTTLNVPSGTVVYMQAAKEGYNYQTISHEITEDGYMFTPTCDWEWGGEFEVNGGNDISINVGECVNLSELITYTPSDYVPQSIDFEKGEDSYSEAISLNTETGEVCGLSETSRPASVKVTINGRHLVWVNVWVGGGTHLYNLTVTEKSTPGQPMPSNPDITVYIDGVPNTYTDHALSFDVAEGTPIRVTASKEGWTANINNEDRSEYSFNMPDEDQYVIIVWTQNKYTLSVTSNTPSGVENPDVVINGVTYSDVSTTVQRQIGHGNSVNITATLSGYTPAYKDHNTGTTITIPFTMIKNTWVDIDWSADTISVTGISLNKNTMALTYASCDGNTYGNTTETLVATISPPNASNKGISWSSNNTSVATVNTNGDVTAKSVGSATITATSKGNTSKKATCVVTVTAATVPTSTISLNKQSTTLTVGETEALTVTRTPSCASDTISWSSNNTTVATVSNGTITAKAAGTTTITAKVGTNGPTADCTVTVTSGIIAVTGVSLNKSSINVNASCDETQTTSETLTATVIPENASNKRVTWSSNNENVVEVSTNGIVTPVASGVATVTVTTEDGNKTADCEVTVTNITNVSSMTINKTTSTLDIGGTDTLRILTIEPDCVEVTWNSDNTNVATVTPGSTLDKRATVTAEGAGTARITATAGNNRKIVNCIVTVNEPGKGIWFKNNSNLISIEVAAGSDGSISLYPQGNAQYINLHSGNVLTFTTDNAYEYIYLTGNAGGCTVPTKLRNGGTITYQNAPTDGCSTENDPILVTVQESGSDTPENTIAD